jgi:hypothetical protein
MKFHHCVIEMMQERKPGRQAGRQAGNNTAKLLINGHVLLIIIIITMALFSCLV